MPLPLPNLDTRRWSDLVSEGSGMVPRYAPDWTDQNAHDPGITLMELFAWLTEMDIYRLNQVPDRHRLKFLALLGYAPKPPQAARAMLAFSPAAGGPYPVPAGAQFETGAGMPFRTLRDLVVWPATLKAILADNGSGTLLDYTGEWLEGIPMGCFGNGLQPGAALYLGFDALPAGGTLALGLRVQSCRNPECGGQRILEEEQLQQQVCSEMLPVNPCPGASPVQPPAIQLKHHSARVSWEGFIGAWTPLIPVIDQSRALTLDGIVELPLPAGLTTSKQGGVVTSLFYLRCRLTAGSYDRAPLLLDVAPNSVWVEQAVPAVATFQIAAGVAAIGVSPVPGTPVRFDSQIDFAGVMQTLYFLAPSDPGHPDVTVLSYQAATALTPGKLTLSMARAGYSDGTPNQVMYLPAAPVQQHSLALYTHFNGIWQNWNRRDDLDASRRTDFHFTLDATSGAIVFGDGERGRVPDAGATVLAIYRRTLAAQGNVLPSQITRITASVWNAVLLAPALQTALASVIANRAPSVAGADQEDLDGAAGRAVEVLHSHERLVELAERYQSTTLDQIDPSLVRSIHAPSRAVNLLDIERLALNVPGTCVARAHAWPGVDAAYPCLRASGVVTLVIVPDLDVSKPLPSAGLIRAVQHYLDLRRILCTRIVVAAPQYLTVTVTAQVALSRGASGTRVQQSVRDAIDAFLDPRTGGPGGLGWPFGRDVFRSEILQVIQAVPGVDHVTSLSLTSGSGRRRMRQHHCLLDVVSHAGHSSNRDGMNNLLRRRQRPHRLERRASARLARSAGGTRRRHTSPAAAQRISARNVGDRARLRRPTASQRRQRHRVAWICRGCRRARSAASQTLAIALPSEGSFVLVATYDAALDLQAHASSRRFLRRPRPAPRASTHRLGRDGGLEHGDPRAAGPRGRDLRSVDRGTRSPGTPHGATHGAAARRPGGYRDRRHELGGRQLPEDSQRVAAGQYRHVGGRISAHAAIFRGSLPARSGSHERAPGISGRCDRELRGSALVFTGQSRHNCRRDGTGIHLSTATWHSALRRRSHRQRSRGRWLGCGLARVGNRRRMPARIQSATAAGSGREHFMNVPDLKRITYFNGQRLTAGDLTEAQTDSRELRWLHNRGLHGWGIASGLQVAGKVGDRAVTVAPGYGTDCVGREIILGAPVSMATPASFARGAEVMFYLVASWLDDADQAVTEKRDGACSGNGAVRLSDTPLLTWRSAKDLQQGMEVILAQVWVQNCRISRAISSAAPALCALGTATLHRQRAGSAYRSHVDALAVRLAVSRLAGGGGYLRGAVRRHAAVFRSIGRRTLPRRFSWRPVMVVGFAAVAAPRRDSFTFQVLLPEGPDTINNTAILSDPATARLIATLLDLQVMWMGVED